MKFIKIFKNLKFYNFSLDSVLAAVRTGDSTAAEIMRAIQSRKSVIINAENKITEAIDIIEEEKNGDYPKAIIFGELKQTANKLYRLLKKNDVKII